MRGIFWFKKDLRLNNNPALYQACKQCTDGIAALYIIDYEMWKLHHTATCQIEFIFRGLSLLKTACEARGFPLLLLETTKTAKIPTLLLNLFSELRAEKLFFNRELEYNEAKRDETVRLQLAQKGIATESYEDQLILPYQQFYDEREKYYQIFTPFKRHWLKSFKLVENSQLYPKPKLKNSIPLASSPLPPLPKAFHSTVDPKNWPAGEAAANAQLRHFIKNKLFSYHERRDFPQEEGTSQLSAYLAVGMISAQECFLAALNENNQEFETGNPGALTWMSELLWREFYRHILIAVPRICKNKAYKVETEKLRWQDNDKHLQAWQAGQTGFPLIDAGMRQLNTLGWMHNRLRMVTAMFLSKNLLLDWRLGEKYFSEKLIDLDFASNNGGWQWSASTGTDAVPYFRIFNPLTQSERFDPQGKFIRQYCPELKTLDNKAIHAPYLRAPLLAKKTAYPHPIIDYASTRVRCLEAFKKIFKDKL